jgi:hypothetical protein
VIGSVPQFYAKEGPSSLATEAAASGERKRELKRKAKEEEAEVGGACRALFVCCVLCGYVGGGGGVVCVGMGGMRAMRACVRRLPFVSCFVYVVGYVCGACLHPPPPNPQRPHTHTLNTKTPNKQTKTKDEEEGPWAPQKDDRVVTELEAGTLTEEQKRFRCVLRLALCVVLFVCVWCFDCFILWHVSLWCVCFFGGSDDGIELTHKTHTHTPDLLPLSPNPPPPPKKKHKKTTKLAGGKWRSGARRSTRSTTRRRTTTAGTSASLPTSSRRATTGASASLCVVCCLCVCFVCVCLCGVCVCVACVFAGGGVEEEGRDKERGKGVLRCCHV